MEQLSGMMDKILDLQHPERLKEKYEAKAQAAKDSQFKALPALIEGNQKVTHGSVIKLRLKDSIILNGHVIPKHQLIYGTCLLSNQRILLDIKTIRLGTSILPVNLSVYDLDGMKGINAPEAVLTETMNNGANNALGDIQLMTMDQSLATQMAGAGLDAAKSLLSKKLKRIKVKLKAGQTVLLRNNELRKKN
jgi:conjugative transposon TraM protein